MMQNHDPAWLAEVRRPGPNGVIDHLAPEATETFIMQDDVTTSQFLPGAAAYAGYWNGSFANMTAVRAYAATQHAATFAYTPDGDTGADGLDIEPGDAVPADAPAFYSGKGGKGVYFYGSASWVGAIVNAMSAAGVARSKYKIISAHYIGSHICAPSTCGYPQADATQFTDSYGGRSLDATLYTAGFFGPPAVPTAYLCSGVIPGSWTGRLLLTGTGTDGNTWYTATVDGKNWTVPSRTAPTGAFSVTTAPPGWYKAGTTVSVSGDGTDGVVWHTSSGNGTVWTAPVKT